MSPSWRRLWRSRGQASLKGSTTKASLSLPTKGSFPTSWKLRSTPGFSKNVKYDKLLLLLQMPCLKDNFFITIHSNWLYWQVISCLKGFILGFPLKKLIWNELSANKVALEQEPSLSKCCYLISNSILQSAKNELLLLFRQSKNKQPGQMNSISLWNV